jgi:hypothetical protein
MQRASIMQMVVVDPGQILLHHLPPVSVPWLL